MDTKGNGVITAERWNGPRTPTEVIETFYERIYCFLRRLTGNDADAADLTQRTFSRVSQKLPTFAGRSSLASWIHSIAYHLFVDWRRADSHTEARSNEWWALRQAPGDTPDEIAARRDMEAAVYATVDSLEADLRATIHLHYYQELTLEETAEAMEVAVSTVKYRRQQALSELQKRLGCRPTSLKTTSSR